MRGGVALEPKGIDTATPALLWTCTPASESAEHYNPSSLQPVSKMAQGLTTQALCSQKHSSLQYK